MSKKKQEDAENAEVDALDAQYEEEEAAPRKQSPAESLAAGLKKWTPEELMSVKHLGPGIIGDEMYAASQAYNEKSGGGVYGPALLGILPDAYQDQTPKKKKDA